MFDLRGAYKGLWLALGEILLLGPSLFAESNDDLFKSRVEPILRQHCYECHSHAGGKAKGGLVLDSKHGWQTGGDSGPAIIPGEINRSRLIAAILYEDPLLQMPPTGKLPDRDISILKRWVSSGAPDPRESELEPPENATSVFDTNHWAFRPIQYDVSPTHDAVSAIDRFIDRHLRKQELVPNREATPHTLLRRTTFNLTGLPPTPREVNEFLAQAPESRFDQAVERLLSTPAFGEHWARHWLDLTAYADTIGTGRALPATNAWRFRDYVIDAFNSDKPFDEFITEQVAGDLIKTTSIADRRENLIATGFLALGPWPLENGDKPQLRMDIVDSQIKRIGKVFLGMTFGCARCHDHKFDPVSQRDYYALAGFFRSTMTLKGRLEGIYSDVYRERLPERPEDMIQRASDYLVWERKLKEAEAARDRAHDAVAKLDKEIEEAESSTESSDSGRQEKLKSLKKTLAEAEQKLGTLKYNRPFAPVANAVTDYPEPENCRINIRGNARTLGAEVPRGYVSAINWQNNEPQFGAGQSGRLELARWLSHPRNPLTARVLANRVWHHLFGRGLVASPDNFGLRGERPSHPELLDYLARRLIDSGWSLKALIREIVATKVYRRSGKDNPAAHAIDPDNRMLWRSNRRRLQAEQIRDAILTAADEMDRTGRGPSLPAVFHQNLALAPPVAIYDGIKFFEHVVPRRTIYQPIKRKSAFGGLGILDAFDFPSTNDETGRRSVTTVANQALFMMNSKFTAENSLAAATSVSRQSRKSDEQIEILYQRILGRTPIPRELKRARSFLRTYRLELENLENEELSSRERKTAALARFAQVLFASNEFLFLR